MIYILLITLLCIKLEQYKDKINYIPPNKLHLGIIK